MFEHPVAASSWQFALVNKFLHVDSAERINFDFCQVGMSITAEVSDMPVEKRTG